VYGHRSFKSKYDTGFVRSEWIAALHAEEEENLFRQTNNIIRDNNVQQYGRLPEEA